MDDHTLLTEFARNGSETAFATLVERYVNLVHSVALRSTGNPHHAQDVTQAVFIILARKAGKLSPRTVLSGWLYQTARLTAANFVKGEIRRQRREQEVYMQSTLSEQDAAAWEQIAPFLDEAMGHLGETDRNAVVLRFFENKSARDVGAALKLSEAAASKRIHRAVEKLRRIFGKRGVTLTGTLIMGAVSANSVQAAPAGLVVTIAGAAAKGSAVSASTLTLVKGVLKIMAWTKAKTAAAASAALILTVGTTTVAVKQINLAREARYPSLQGAWEGTLSVPQANANLQLVFNLDREGRKYVGTIDSLDQGIGGVPFTGVTYKYPSVRLEANTIGGMFDGTLDKDSGVISGMWTQGELNLPLELAHTDQPTRMAESMSEADYAVRPGSPVQGLWQGTLMIEDVPLRLDFRIAESSTGTIRVQVDSVDQGSRNLPASSASYRDSALELEFSSLKATFQGRMMGGDDTITGTWSQAGKQWPLTLKRGDPTQEAFRKSYIDYGYTHEDELPGHWEGKLDMQGTQLALIFNIGKLTDGEWGCTMVSVDQGGVELPATMVEWSAPTVRLAWKAVGGTFEGNVENGKLNGVWRQGKVALPLEMERRKAN